MPVATLSPAEVRRRIATAITTAMGSNGWRETTGVIDNFGEGDGEGRLHKSFSVGVPASSALTDRQRLTEGAYTDTSVRVRLGYNLAALDQLTSYDEAIQGEDAVRAAVMQARMESLHVLFSRSSRSVADGWMLVDMEFRAIHHAPLT